MSISTTTRIRPASDPDTDVIRDLIGTVLAEYGLTLDPTGIDADLSDIEAHYQAPGGIFDVIEGDDSQLLGTVGLMPMGEGVCELRKMYLRQDARGQGLGRKLMEHALAAARSLGFHRIELETASVLKEALGLYARYDFRAVPGRDVCGRCDQLLALDLR